MPAALKPFQRERSEPYKQTMNALPVISHRMFVAAVGPPEVEAGFDRFERPETSDLRDHAAVEPADTVVREWPAAKASRAWLFSAEAGNA